MNNMYLANSKISLNLWNKVLLRNKILGFSYLNVRPNFVNKVCILCCAFIDKLTYNELLLDFLNSLQIAVKFF